MNELKLNETPIRTSRNFLINNIKLTDVEIPETVEKFKNIEIRGLQWEINRYPSGIKMETLFLRPMFGIQRNLKNSLRA